MSLRQAVEALIGSCYVDEGFRETPFQRSDDVTIESETDSLAGDANRDGAFNQLDIVQILQSTKYQTGQPATWTEGDFNGDSVFDQLDIVAALQTGKYGQT